MGCGGCSQVLVISSGSGPNVNNGCDDISLDTLNMYRTPINCILQAGTAVEHGFIEMDLIGCLTTLNAYIELKKIDPKDCTYQPQMSFIQHMVGKIIEKGICL